MTTTNPKLMRWLEGMARTIEQLLEDLRRRGVIPDADTHEYDEYRREHPRQDA